MKTFKEYLNESPKINYDLDASNTKSWTDDAQNYWDVNKKSAKLVDKKFELYQLGSDANGYYMSVHNDKVAYFAHYKSVNIKFMDKSYGRQVFIRRSEHTSLSFGAPKIVFFNYLLPKFKSMVSDTEQSYDGKKFWEGAVAEAIRESGFSVQVLDTKNGKFVDIKTIDEWDSTKPHIWGENDLFKRYVIVINKL